MLSRFVRPIMKSVNYKSVSTISINGFKEDIVERNDYPINICQKI